MPRTLLAAWLMASNVLAQTSPAPKLSGHKVTAEGGVEGTRTYRYDEQGRPIEGTPRLEDPSPNPTGVGPTPRPTTVTSTPSPNAANNSTRQLTTADGRALPFNVTGSTGPKTVDGTVDADSALRDFARPSALGDQRFETQRADLTQDPRFSTSQRVTLDRWTSKFSTLGGQRSDVTLENSLDANVRAKESIEIQALEQPTSPWSRVTANPTNWEQRIGESAEIGGRRVAREEISTMGTRSLSGDSRRLEQLSMQDINRYQFRRARSSEPGLPVINPAGQGNVRQTAPGR